MKFYTFIHPLLLFADKILQFCQALNFYISVNAFMIYCLVFYSVNFNTEQSTVTLK